MLGAAGIAVAAVSAASASPPPTVVYLASNAGPDITAEACAAQHGCGPMVSAPTVLRAGQSYTIRVQGTISAWSYWVAHPCGNPEPRAEFPTPGPLTPTSDDAQFRFAIHLRPIGSCAPLPRKTTLFQINLGSGWFHPIAVGNPSRPSQRRSESDQHPYLFRVIGQGVAPSFRYVDYHPSDNNGKFKISISAEP